MENQTSFKAKEIQRPKGQLETCACGTRPNGDPLVPSRRFVLEHQQRHVWCIGRLKRAIGSRSHRIQLRQTSVSSNESIGRPASPHISQKSDWPSASARTRQDQVRQDQRVVAHGTNRSWNRVSGSPGPTSVSSVTSGLALCLQQMANRRA